MKNVKTIGAVALLLLLAAVCYLFIAIGGYSGREGAIDDDSQSEVELPSVERVVDSLALGWDSEASPRWPVAELMAELCKTAYEPLVDAKSTFQKLGFDKWETIADGAMIGYVLIHQETAVVVFRGTDNKVDWLVNMTATSVPTENGLIHRGFHDAYKASDAGTPLKPQVDKVLAEHSIKKVWISGHSLGGALALVAADDLLSQGAIEIAGVMTFGQPAVAKSELANHLDLQLLGRYARFVNHDDIVPRIPITYEPCGRLVWFTDTGLKRSEPKRMVASSSGVPTSNSQDIEEVEMMSPEEFRQFRQRLKENQTVELPDGKVAYGTSFSQISDHSMDEYCKEIAGLLK